MTVSEYFTHITLENDNQSFSILKYEQSEEGRKYGVYRYIVDSRTAMLASVRSLFLLILLFGLAISYWQLNFFLFLGSVMYCFLYAYRRSKLRMSQVTDTLDLYESEVMNIWHIHQSLTKAKF